MVKTKEILVRLDEATFAALAARRAETGSPVSEFVRRCIERELGRTIVDADSVQQVNVIAEKKAEHENLL